MSYPLFNWADLSAGVGVKALRELENKSSTYVSTITQYQNMAQTGQQVLNDGPGMTSGSKDKKVISWRMMTYADLTEWLKLFATVRGVKDGQPNYGAGVQIDIGRLID